MYIRSVGDSEVGLRGESSGEAGPFTVVMSDVALSTSRAVVSISGGHVRFGLAFRTICIGTHSTK